MARRRAVTVGNMSNESKNSNDSVVPQSQQSEPQWQPATPRPFPKSNYIRPGIDDRPDLDKALSAEDKSAVARLAVRQKPVTAPPAATHPEVQAAALADAAGLAHAASDEPIPDVESAFFDLRDPMVDSTGYRPTRTQVLRMKIGFAAASLLLSFAMVALTVVLVPLRLDEFGGAFDGTVNLAVLIGVGIVVAMLMTAFASAMSDRTRLPLGRRTPWLIGGTVVATLFAFALSACHTNVAMILVWVFMQLGYAVMAMACSAMMGEMVPDKFRDAVATWRNVAMFAGSLAGAAFAAGMADHVDAAMDICAVAMLAAGAVALFVPPHEHSSEYLHVTPLDEDKLLVAFRAPQGVRHWGVIAAIRLLVSATLAVSITYVWFLVRYEHGTHAPNSLQYTAVTIAAMAVVAYVLAAISSVLLDPIASRFSSAKAPLALASAVMLLAAICGIAMPNRAGLILFAAFGGCALAMLDSLAQAQALHAIEDLQHTGHVLAVLHSLDSVGRLLGVVVGAIVVVAADAFAPLFIAAGVLALALLVVVLCISSRLAD